MAKYKVYAVVTGGKYVGEVEADSKEEAVEKGWKHENCGARFCHHCSEECEDPQIEKIEVDKQS